MLQAWNVFLFLLMLSTRPLTALSLIGMGSFSNSATRVPDTGDGSLVDVHIQVSPGDVVSITDTRSSIQTVNDALPASASFSPHPSSSIAISTKLQDALVSSPTSTPSPEADASSNNSGSLIFASNSTEAFVTDFKGAYTVPPALTTFSVGTMIAPASGSNGHSPAANSGSPIINSGAQISPGPSVTTVDGTSTPTTNSAGLLIPWRDQSYHWAQLGLVLVGSHALLSFV